MLRASRICQKRGFFQKAQSDSKGPYNYNIIDTDSSPQTPDTHRPDTEFITEPTGIKFDVFQLIELNALLVVVARLKNFYLNFTIILMHFCSD